MSFFKKKKKIVSPCVKIPYSQHNISCDSINRNALKVLNGLKDAGFEAYLVGGCVRDLLVGLHPKDFDVVTDAHPEQVKEIFKNCILIGRRFRLAHVRFGREIIEVATFRGIVTDDTEKHKRSEHGMLLRDNVYGTIKEDVWRRDFAVNALYYRIKDLSIIDYTNGFSDLKNKIIRVIGEPGLRYREDPVRMMRALRFAAKLGFVLEENTVVSIAKMSHLFANVSSARLFEEVAKWFRSGKSLEIFHLLRTHNLFPFLFAQTAKSLQGKNQEIVAAMLHHGFANTDRRIHEGKMVIPAFLYAVLLWWPLQEQIEILRKDTKMGITLILHRAMQNILQQQKKQTMIPQWLIFTIKDIWQMQNQFLRRQKREIHHLLTHPRFRAAYDFLLLRAAVDAKIKEVAVWWTRVQEVGELERAKMIEELNG